MVPGFLSRIQSNAGRRLSKLAQEAIDKNMNGAAFVGALLATLVLSGTLRADDKSPPAGKGQDDDKAMLIKLNRATFKAEDDLDAKAMAELLTDDFFIVRASGALSKKEAALKETVDPARKGLTREVVDGSEDVRVSGNGGFVACLITLKRDGRVVGQFRNLKVCAKGNDGKWRCVAWQVTEVAPKKP